MDELFGGLPTIGEIVNVSEVFSVSKDELKKNKE